MALQVHSSMPSSVVSVVDVLFILFQKATRSFVSLLVLSYVGDLWETGPTWQEVQGCAGEHGGIVRNALQVVATKIL